MSVVINGTTGITAPAATFAGGVSGSVVQAVEAAPYTTWATSATVIPADDTIPQNTEGGQYQSVTITPKNASNRLLIEAIAECVAADSQRIVTGAIFQDGGVNAIAAACITTQGAGNLFSQLIVKHEMAAGTTSATTFYFRIGPSAGSMALNGSTATRFLGGTQAVRMRVTEFAA